MRRELEKLAAPSESALKTKADTKIKEIDGRLDTLSNDPLPDIATVTVAFHDAYLGNWVTGAIKVPGNLR
jgi:hypothetical protein